MTHDILIRRAAPPFFLALLLLLLQVGCTRSGEQPAAPSPTPATPIERGIQLARRQLAKNIFVIARPDGSEITADDRAFIRQNLPRDYVYSGITDDNRNVIVSMHIEFPAENLTALRTRYTVSQVQT